MTNVNTPILNLPPTVGSLTGSEYVPIVQGGTTKKTTTSNIGATLVTVGFPANIEYVIDGGGSNLVGGVKGYLVVPFNCTAQSVRLLPDKQSSIVIDIWKCAGSVFDAGVTAPTSANSITGSTPPTISNGTSYFDQALVGWTSSFAQSDVLAYNVVSASNVARITVALQCQRSLLSS